MSEVEHRARSGGHRPAPGPGGPWFWIGLVLGVAVMAYAVAGIVADRPATVPSDLVRWLLAAGVVHDALVLPATVAVGWLVARLLPRWAATPVQLGLAWSALVTVMFWPAVRGWGRRETNPSLLPLDYPRNLVLTLVVTWLVVGVVVARRAWHRRRSPVEPRGVR